MTPQYRPRVIDVIISLGALVAVAVIVIPMLYAILVLWLSAIEYVTS